MKSYLQRKMTTSFSCLILLLFTGCSKSPEQARKDLTAMGIPFTQSAFYQSAQRCDTLPIDNFLAGEMEPGIGLVGAADGGCLPIVKKLIDKTKNEEALATALNKVLQENPDPNRIEIAKLLLGAGVNPNVKIEGKNSFLNDAVTKNYIEIVKLLLDKGAEPNDGGDGNSIALISAAGISTEVTKMLLDKGANPSSVGCPDYESCTPLLAATNSGNIETVKLLLDKKANVNDGKNGISLSLQEAVRQKQIEIAKLLLKAGAKVNDGQNGESRVLQLAFAGITSNDSNLEMIKLLLDNGANPNTRTGYNGAALYDAIAKNNIELMKLVLAHKPIINDNDGSSSALNYAVKESKVEAVRLLLEHGASPNRNHPKDSCTILDNVLRKRNAILIPNEQKKANEEIVSLLKAKGATTNDTPSFYCH